MLKVLLCLLFAVFSVTAIAQPYESFPDHITSGSLAEDFDGDLNIADTGEARPLILIAVNLIKDFEAWRGKAYNDASMYCTIGYGHLIDKLPCAQINLPNEFATPLSIEAGLVLLEQDTRSARLAVTQLVHVDLNDEQYGALTSFVFNVGKGNFAKSTMLAMLNDGDIEGASNQFMRWVRSKGVVLDGLVTRRGCEQALFQGNLPYGDDQEFDRNSCSDLGGAPPAGDLIDIEVGE